MLKKPNPNFEKHFDVIIKHKEDFIFEPGRSVYKTEDPLLAVEFAKKCRLNEDEIVRIKLLDGRDITIESLEEYLESKK